MAYLDDERLRALNDLWTSTPPERIHQSRGDSLKLRLEVRDPTGATTKFLLRVGQGQRKLERGSGILPDAIVTLDEDTLQRVLSSEDPCALTGELAAGTIRVRGNSEKLYENLGDVLAVSDGPTRSAMAALTGAGS
jgi:hypothetical protein